MNIKEGRYYAIDVAKYVINKCTNDNNPISNLQLQKILYFLQKNSLENGFVLLRDDFQAWSYGPVIPKVYFEYCSYGAMCIIEKNSIDIVEEIRKQINPIIEELRTEEPWELVRKTHFPDGAWDTVYKGGIGNKRIIPLELIISKDCNND